MLNKKASLWHGNHYMNSEDDTHVAQRSAFFSDTPDVAPVITFKSKEGCPMLISKAV